MLSVLLRRMDGFDASENTALIGATNRKSDLDVALISRFDVQVHALLACSASFRDRAQHVWAHSRARTPTSMAVPCTTLTRPVRDRLSPPHPPNIEQVHVPPPDAATRANIFARYGRQLPVAQLCQLANQAEGLSGREILDVCRQTERRWASVLLRKGFEQQQQSGRTLRSSTELQLDTSLPPLAEYEAALARRQSAPA